MNYLELVQRLHREGGFGGWPPNSVVGAKGETRLLADWISDAWLDIQRMNVPFCFRWDRCEMRLGLANEQSKHIARDYDISKYAGRIRTDSVTIRYKDDIDEEPLPYVPYEVWKAKFPVDDNRERRPECFTILPSQVLRVGPGWPDKMYVLKGDYQRATQFLKQDDDVPYLMEEYHMLLVWKALMLHGAYIESAARYKFAIEQEHKMMAQLLMACTPKIYPAFSSLA